LGAPSPTANLRRSRSRPGIHPIPPVVAGKILLADRDWTGRGFPAHPITHKSPSLDNEGWRTAPEQFEAAIPLVVPCFGIGSGLLRGLAILS